MKKIAGTLNSIASKLRKVDKNLDDCESCTDRIIEKAPKKTGIYNIKKIGPIQNYTSLIRAMSA